MSTDEVENHHETEAVESDGVMEVNEVVQEEAGNSSPVENHEEVENVLVENDVHCSDDSHVQLVQRVVELKFENEYLKAQFEGLKSMHVQTEENIEEREVVARDVEVSEVEKELREQIEALNRELLDKTQTQVAAEDALKHLQAAYFDADERAQELSSKLAEAQQKMDQEIKERDDKYNELDAKLGRLHKRAKQRIQDVQKEKDDLEVRVRDLNEMSERASSQQSSLQQELERTRQQTKEALRAIDVDRQQLRTANTKLRDNIEEVNRMLETKENALEGLQRSLLEKEQMLGELRGLLQTEDEKRLASVAELSAKHQKQVESLEAQLADALSERSKAAETISSLQVLVGEKESKIVEMDAAASGEAVRLKAAVENEKGELVKLKLQHDKEKENWEAAYETLRAKLEVAEGTFLRSEIEAAKIRSQLELELSLKNQLLNGKETELVTIKEEKSRIESEFSSYKIRAHALLQKKDAELSASKDTESLKAQEEAIKEAEREVAVAFVERDRALQTLKDAVTNHDNELSARNVALSNAEQRIKSLEMKLDFVNSQHRSEKEAWQKDIENLEETWRLRCEGLMSRKDENTKQDLQRDLEELRLQHKRLKEEHNSFRDIADRMIEEKDKEISRLIDQIKSLNQSLLMRPTVSTYNQNTGLQKQDATSALEQQILILARQQAQREEELAQSQRHIYVLQVELEELQHENRLHSQQEAMLKEELRNMERMKKRDGVDMTYLKNVVLKLLETGEVEALLPVIGMLLQFSPDEIQKCQQAYRSLTEVPPSPSSETPSGGGSLFSRFSFS
ncbi:hypothetical protein ACHQM5_015877 [Ranunculus cassubicifolius]